jgi:hypothetical protein
LSDEKNLGEEDKGFERFEPKKYFVADWVVIFDARTVFNVEADSNFLKGALLLSFSHDLLEINEWFTWRTAKFCPVNWILARNIAMQKNKKPLN